MPIWVMYKVMNKRVNHRHQSQKKKEWLPLLARMKWVRKRHAQIDEDEAVEDEVEVQEDVPLDAAA